MRTLILLLILVNLGVFAWFHWVAPKDDGLPAARLSADTGQPLYLVGEDTRLPDALPAPAEDDGAILADANENAENENEKQLAAGPVGESGAGTAVADSSEPENSEAVDATGPQAGDGSPSGAGGSEQGAARGAEQEVVLACASLGPFDDENLAQTVVGRLLERGYVPELRSTGGQIRSGYWVYLPPFDDRDTAKATETRLRDRGVKDLFIVTGEENRNAISLGLYSTAERADQRAAEIGRLGFSPRVAERFRDATVYWVDFREKPGQELQPQSIGVLDAADLLPEKKSIPCTEIR